MNYALSKVARALSFAHLAGIGARAEDTPPKETPPKEDPNNKGSNANDQDKNYAEDEERKQREGESDEDYKARMEELDEKEKSKKAEENPDKKPDAEDDDEEMRGNSACAKARRRERARCAAIFASPAAANNPVLAANLAFQTSMSRKEALAVLESTPGARGTNPTRSAGNPNIGGQAPAPSKQQAIASRWDDAFARVPGHRRG